MNPRILSGIILLSLAAAPSFATETVTISGFLPSPRVAGQTLWLNPHTEAMQTGCTAGTIYLGSDGNLYICGDNGAGSTAYSYPTGSFKSVGNYIFPTATATNPNLRVGIGTSAPSEKFHLKDGSMLVSYQTGTSSENNVFLFNSVTGALMTGYQPSTLANLPSLGAGAGSLTYGYASLADGDYSMAGGFENTAGGKHTVALGYQNAAGGGGGVAIGGINNSNGRFSLAAGYQNTAAGDMSTAIGYGNTTTDEGAVAITDADISGLTPVAAFAAGYGNTAQGTGATAIGNSNYANGSYSVALGNLITVTGRYNVGIGAGSAAKTFNTVNAIGLMGPVLATPNTSVPLWWSSTIALGGYAALFDGKIGYSGSPTSVSDIRAKINITGISNALNIIQELKPIQYQLIRPSVDETGHLIFDAKPENIIPEIQTGLAAQDVYKVFPDAVEKPADETKTPWLVSYNDFIPVLIQAVKEHKAETDELKGRIEALEAQIKALQK